MRKHEELRTPEHKWGGDKTSTNSYK